MPSTETYRSTHIMTATPMELITMLYDECVSALNKAEEAFKIEGPERFQEISNNILHAQDIITELSVSLDMEKGGQIASNLQRLYDFMITHLCSANTRKVVQPVIEVREMMADLGETWKKVAEQAGNRNSTFSENGEIVV
jgi:flagellar secretion chaperone FliS